MAYATSTLLIASLVATAIGAGVSAYGQFQQGQTQQNIANFNAAQQEKQAKAQMLGMQTQAALRQQEAEANFKLRSAEAAAHVSNAEGIESQALMQDRVNRVNLRKRAEEFARMQGTQRAAIAASGVTESSGTPLDLLAETAGKIQQDQEESHYANEVQRHTLFSEAAAERLGGKLALAGATLDRDSGVAAAGLQNAAAGSQYAAGVRGAEISRLTGSAAKSASIYQAGGTLFGAAGDAGKSYLTYKRG